MSQKQSKSELRRDPVSGEWLILAPEFSAKPSDLVDNTKKRRTPSDIKTCPFEHPQKSGNEKPYLVYPNSANSNAWRAMVFANKFPVLQDKVPHARGTQKGPYTVIAGFGHHDVLVTRDHAIPFAFLPEEEAEMVFSGFIDRYNQVVRNPRVEYVSIFQNWGGMAGATLYHPHYQILSLPVLPADVIRSLAGAEAFFKKTKQCVYCKEIAFERRQKTRIVFENDGAIVYAPFFSKEPFELHVFPKRHNAHFTQLPQKEMLHIIRALQQALRSIFTALNDPDYNFLIHAAPPKYSAKNAYYHWHIEIVPKMGKGKEGGFEVSTGMQINKIDPDIAARILKQ